MNDALFDAPQTPDPTPPAAPAPAPAPAAAPADDGRIGRLENMVGRLVEQLHTLANTPAPQPVAPPAPPPAPNEQVNRFVENPEKWTAEQASAVVNRTLQEAVNPALQQILGAASQSLLSQHALRVDERFGGGTWDTMFKPQIETDLERLRAANPQAAAHPATIEALVDRLYGGENFTKLQERLGAHQQAARAQEEAGIKRIISKLPPIGGVPRLRGANGEDTIPEDVEALLKTIDEKTGTTTDRKLYAKLSGVGVDTGRGRRTDVVDYLRATGASPETIKAHGG